MVGAFLRFVHIWGLQVPFLHGEQFFSLVGHVRSFRLERRHDLAILSRLCYRFRPGRILVFATTRQLIRSVFLEDDVSRSRILITQALPSQLFAISFAVISNIGG